MFHGFNTFCMMSITFYLILVILMKCMICVNAIGFYINVTDLFGNALENNKQKQTMTSLCIH